MPLYRRKGSPFWYYSFSINGKRFRGSTGKTTKREAQRVEDDEKQSIRARGGKVKEWTMKTLCDAYWDERGKDRPSSQTILGQLAALRRIIGAKRKLSSITNSTIMDYRAKRRGDPGRAKGSQLSKQSVNRDLTVLRAAMRHVEELHDVAVPKLRWDRLFYDESRGRVRFLTVEEFGDLLDASEESIRPILVCAVTTGLRKANILTLNWRQVNLGTRRINVVAKGDEDHEVRISAYLAEVLLALPDRKGRVFDTTNFEKRWRAARAAAGLKDFRFHDLRHTFASWARQGGSDIADVKEALGHSDVSMTMRYAHIKPDAPDTAFDRVSSALSSQRRSQGLQKREN